MLKMVEESLKTLYAKNMAATKAKLQSSLTEDLLIIQAVNSIDEKI